MADLRVRNVDDQALEALRARARRHGHSLADEIRALIRDEAARPRRELAERLRHLHEEIIREHGVLPDSTPLIREDRDTRG